ncbi:hypothetical protein [Streptomyces sp. NPDC093071]
MAGKSSWNAAFDKAVGLEFGERRPVWEAMEELAERHGDDNVRFVVWFDD